MRPPPPRPTLFPYTTLFRSPPRRASAPPSRRAPCRSSSGTRSEEHTSDLQSPYDLVCRLLLEKKKKLTKITTTLSQFTPTKLSSCRTYITISPPHIQYNYAH